MSPMRTHDPKQEHGYNARSSDRNQPRTPTNRQAPRFVIRKAIPAANDHPWHVRELCEDCTALYRRPIWPMAGTYRTFEEAIERTNR